METSVLFGLLLLLVPVGVTALIVSLYWRKRGAHVPSVAAGSVAGSIALGPALGGGLGWALEAAGYSRNADMPIGLMLGVIVGFPIGAMAGGILAGIAVVRWAETPTIRRWALAGLASGSVAGWPVILLLPRTTMGPATAVFGLYIVGVLLAVVAAALARSLQWRPGALRSAAVAAVAALVALTVGGVACGPSLRGRVLNANRLEASRDAAALRTVIADPDPRRSPYELQRASQAYARVDPQAALRSTDADTRYRAAMVLGEQGDDGVLPVLIQAAADPKALRSPYGYGDEPERARLIYALGRFQQAEAVEAISAVLAAPRTGSSPAYQTDLPRQAAMDAAGRQADARHLRPLAAIAGSAGDPQRWRAAVALARVVLASGDRRADARLAPMTRSKELVQAHREAVAAQQYRAGAGGPVQPMPSTEPAISMPDGAAERRTPNAADIIKTLRAAEQGVEALTKSDDVDGLARLAEADPMWRDSAIYALGQSRSPRARAALARLARSQDAATARLAGGSPARAQAAAVLGHEAPIPPASVRAQSRVARLSKAMLLAQGRHRGITALALVVRDRAHAPTVACLIISRARYDDSQDRWGWGASWGGPPDAEYCRVDLDRYKFGTWKYARILPKAGPAIETLTVSGAPYDVRRGRLFIAGDGPARQLRLPAQASGTDLKWEAKPDACVARIIDLTLAHSPEVAALAAK